LRFGEAERCCPPPPTTQVGDIQLDSGHNVPINCSLVIGNRAGGMLLPALDSRP
jgi:hypothetical protein